MEVVFCTNSEEVASLHALITRCEKHGHASRRWRDACSNGRGLSVTSGLFWWSIRSLPCECLALCFIAALPFLCTNLTLWHFGLQCFSCGWTFLLKNKVHHFSIYSNLGVFVALKAVKEMDKELVYSTIVVSMYEEIHGFVRFLNYWTNVWFRFLKGSSPITSKF